MLGVYKRYSFNVSIDGGREVAWNIARETEMGDWCWWEQRRGGKSLRALSRPPCKAPRGSGLAEGCDAALSLMQFKWIMFTCVCFPCPVYILPSLAKAVLSTFKNNGLRMIIPVVPWAPVWPGFAQYSLESLTVLDNTLRFNYRHTMCFLPSVKGYSGPPSC